MSQNSQGSMGLATTLAIGIFLVAFACLWTLGDFTLFPAAFLAAVIALIAWIVLYIGLGRGTGDATAGMSQSTAPSSKAASVAAPAAAAGATTSDADHAAEAAAAKRAADAEAAERAAADEARRKAEAAEAKRKADADAAEAKRAADEADAKRKADAEAKRAADEAESKRKAEEAAAEQSAAEAAHPGAETTPDYDGDGVREGVNEGTRPAGLDAPRDGKADDLKQIKGIGAKMEALCNRLGFWHFDQIASWTADEVAWVDANLEGFKGRVTRDTWVEQAKVLAAGGETEFSKRVEDGDVY